MNMSQEGQETAKAAGSSLLDHLTDAERRKLLANLHHFSVWIGIQIPEELQIDPDVLREQMEKDHMKESDLFPEVHPEKGVIDLRHLVWKLIHEKEISEKERTKIKELIRVLKTKEVEEEEILKQKNLTHEQAKELYEETAGVIRTLLDLKDILTEKKHQEMEREIKKKVEDVKKWNEYADEVKEK